MRTRTTGRSFWCGIIILGNCWSGYREVSVPCRTARTGSWCEEVLLSVWVNPLLQALIDAAQSEQTSRTIRIVCTILVSLLYLIGLACLFLLVFVIEGQGLFIRGFFLVMGIIVLAGYLQFLKAIVRKREKKP